MCARAVRSRGGSKRVKPSVEVAECRRRGWQTLPENDESSRLRSHPVPSLDRGCPESRHATAIVMRQPSSQRCPEPAPHPSHQRGRRPAGGMHSSAQAQPDASPPFRGAAAPESAARRQRRPVPMLERYCSAMFAERPLLAVRAAEGSLDQLYDRGHREGRGYHRLLQRRGASHDEPTGPSRPCAKAQPAGTRRSHRAPPGLSHDDFASCDVALLLRYRINLQYKR